MKMIIKNILIAIFLIVSLSFFSACNSGDKNRTLTQEEKDDRYARINIDDGVYNLMEKPCLLFDSLDAKAELTIKKAPAWECMKELLTGSAEAIVTPMPITKYWDSIMTKYNVKTPVKMKIAYDALTFYVKFESPLDSLTDEQIVELMMNKDKKISDYFKNIKGDYGFVTSSPLSSETVNLHKLVLKGKKEKKRIFYAPNQDSVKLIVKSTNAIGIGYLSQIIHDPDLRALRISFIDSSGKYVFPHAVHQANIVRKLYPYIVTHYIYIISNTKEAAMRLGRYISKQGNAQRYFLNSGIVPAFAKIKLINEVD